MNIRFSNKPELNETTLIHQILVAYSKDVSPLKVDLVVGNLKSEDGSVYLLPVVKKAQQMVLEETLNHDYLSMSGVDGFPKAASTMVLGDIEKQWKDGLVYSVQSLGGGGGIRIGANSLLQLMNCTTVYISNPSWENHRLIFSDAGFKNIFDYRYVNMETKTLDFEGLCEDLSNASSNSVIVLHACSHNPTSVDPTKEQWKRIAEIIKERKLIPFFDIAYQGIMSGDIEEDCWAIRYFLHKGFEFMCAHSFSKIFTMYNERVGNLIFVLKSSDNMNLVKSYTSRTIRTMYGNPPNHGAKTILKILTDPQLFDEWLSSFKMLVNQMKYIRVAFRKALEELGAPGTWNHVTNQSGMFIFLNLTDNQMEYLQSFHHVYIMTFGRINVTGLNKSNIDYVAKAISDTLKKNI